MNNIPENKENNLKTKTAIPNILLLGLLLLRYPILTIIPLFSHPSWLEPVYYIGTYFVTSFLIFWERKRLSDFNIDKLALIIILVAGPAETVARALLVPPGDPLSFPNIPSLFYWIISIALFLLLLRNRVSFAINKNNVFALFTGIILAFLLSIILAFPVSKEAPDCIINSAIYLNELKSRIIPLIIIQLGLAAIAEEPLFRGFIWGYLKKAGWKNIWICVFQTIIFMIGHIPQILTSPFTFWIVIPISGFFFGLLVWKTKSLSSTLGAHTIINTFLRSFGCIINSIFP